MSSWREVMRVDILGLVPEFGRKAFRFEYYIGWGFVVSVFYYVEICSLFTHVGKIFVMSGGWILSNAFSASIEIVMWLLSFFLLMWCITLIDLHMLKNLGDPGMNPTWWWYMIFFMYVGFGLLKFCWGFLCLYSSKLLAFNFLSFFFFLALVSGLQWPHRMNLEVSTLLWSFASLRRICIRSPLYVWWTIKWK